jgi:hypothetical protein
MTDLKRWMVFAGRAACAMALPLLFAGCECIFLADFDADAVGGLPDATLPGLPEGDSLAFGTSAGTITVRATAGTLLNQPVEVALTGGTGGVDLLGTVAGTPPKSGVWIAAWESIVQSEPDTFLFGPMVFRDSSGRILASVEYRGGGIIDFNSLFTESGIGVSWGQNQSLSFELEIDLDNHVTSLSIGGAPVASCQNVPFYEEAASDLAHMNFEVGTTTPQTYALDNLEICPLLP